jgi:hypothetical protein
VILEWATYTHQRKTGESGLDLMFVPIGNSGGGFSSMDAAITKIKIDQLDHEPRKEIRIRRLSDGLIISDSNIRRHLKNGNPLF